MASSQLVERAAAASRASRRCTVLCIGDKLAQDALFALQECWCEPQNGIRRRKRVKQEGYRALPFQTDFVHQALSTSYDKYSTHCAIQNQNARRRTKGGHRGDPIVPPESVNALYCQTPLFAASHMRQCAIKATQASAQARTTSSGISPDQNDEDGDFEDQVHDRVAQYLSQVLCADTHEVRFLLATHSLSSLAQINCEEQYQDVLHASAGMIQPELLTKLLRWLRRDAPAGHNAASSGRRRRECHGEAERVTSRALKLRRADEHAAEEILASVFGGNIVLNAVSSKAHQYLCILVYNYTPLFVVLQVVTIGIRQAVSITPTLCITHKHRENFSYEVTDANLLPHCKTCKPQASSDTIFRQSVMMCFITQV
eukprot:4316453-Pleurochrysis_carterae.AAC.5